MSNDRIIKAAVNKFLGWKLPKDFRPDAGISFTPAVLPSTPQVYEGYWPIGTNLLNAIQAEQMFRHCLSEITISDNGPAFPESDTSYGGMTLRDYFATKAMVIKFGRRGTSVPMETMAKACYEMADAMLKERNK